MGAIMEKRPTIVLVEDTLSLATTYAMYLGPLGNVISCHTAEQAMATIAQTPPELVILDLNLPDRSGSEVLTWIKENHASDVIIVTAHGSVDTAMEMIRLGASDFLEKPVTADRLRTTAKNCLENYQLRTTVNAYKKTLTRDHYHGFIGASIPIQAVYKTIDAAAPSNATVFITGESGTGKEVCAEAIKLQSARKNKPFIAINCGAIPRDLIESELFGHVKGAFTGAQNERKGAILSANEGTLFLDEIGEMPLDLQTKLLRFLQNNEVQKVGSSKVEKVDVRVICATNRDPFAEVEAGRFREDLYYRLNVLPIDLPPLRERDRDIILLANAFLKKFAAEENKPFEKLSEAVEQILMQYPWPGNIRQLQNVIRNIVVLHNHTVVDVEHLPAPLNQPKWQGHRSEEVIAPVDTPVEPPPTAIAAPIQKEVPPAQEQVAQPFYIPGISHDGHQRMLTLAEIERLAIEQAINIAGGNIPKAAALLDVSPSTLYRKKQHWDKNNSAAL